MRASLILLLPLLTACFDNSEDVANPTGDCVAEDEGGRDCYHAPDPSDSYLPDCDAPLDREYWRVFAREGEEGVYTAYMIPRPDATGITWGICDGEDAALAELFERNLLCQSSVGQDELEVINAMDVAEALEISHALHERLVFSPIDYGDGWSVEPFAPERDLAEACVQWGSDYPDAAEVCDELVGNMEAGTCMMLAQLYSEAEATDMAALMNRLYGIE